MYVCFVVRQKPWADVCRLKSVGFEIERDYVGRIVGSHGSGVNKLRESLGVKIDFSDDGDETKDTGKKKKGVGLKSKVTVSKTFNPTAGR